MASLTGSRELHDLELEQYMIYHLLFHERKHELVVKCFPSLFHFPEHEEIFKAIRDLGVESDWMSVSKYLDRKQAGVSQGLAMLVGSLDQYLVERTNPDVLIKYLKIYLYRRTVFVRARNLANIAENLDDEHCANQVAQELDKLSLLERKLLKSDKISSVELSELTAGRINELDDQVVTGLNFINRRIYGLTRASLSALLAKPSHMKSSFTDCLIANTVERSKYRGLIISLEDSKEERVKRIISPRLGISLSDMKFKKVKVEQKDIESVLSGTLGGRLTVLDSLDVLTPEDAFIAIMDIKPDIVVIDHLQEFELGGDMVISLIQAVRKIKTAAVRCNAHVMITSQVADKQFKGRESQAPTAADAQWTSALRQAATEMFSLWYPYVDSNNEYASNILKFYFLKGRFSKVRGEVTLEIDPDKSLIKGETFEGK